MSDINLDPNELWPAQVDKEFVSKLREHVKQNIQPSAEKIDREDYYPVSIMKELASNGYNSIVIDQKYNGMGLTHKHALAVFEELGVASAAVGISLITIYQAQMMIKLFAGDSLKSKFLPEFSKGLLTSYALTEANHGSDIRQLDTKAEQTANGWVINGEKHFITSSTAAEMFVILAQTPKGVSVFTVPKDSEGLSLYEGKNSATFGLRNGPHMNVVFKNVKVPQDHMVGTEGKGVRQAVTVLNYSRTMAGAISLGVARAAFEGALTFARDRVAFDQRVLDFQGMQWYFAEMLTEIDGARLLLYQAADALDTDNQVARWGSEAKLKASSVATDVAIKAAQICGAYGIMENAPFGRYIRDAKAYEVAGGSSEILKNTIAKSLKSIALGKPSWGKK